MMPAEWNQLMCPTPTVETISGGEPCVGIELSSLDGIEPLLIEGDTFYGCRDWLDTGRDWQQAFSADLLFALRTLAQKTLDAAGVFLHDHVMPSGEGNEWAPNNEGLYVLIHGLGGHPVMWDRHAWAIRGEHPEAEVRQPFVPMKGKTSLEDAASSIVDIVRDYIAQNPGCPVSFIGVSNGARIATYVENELRDTPSAVRAGVHFGTEAVPFLIDSGIVDVLDSIGLASTFFSSENLGELAYASETAQGLLEALREPLPEGVERDYDFYATTEDHMLWPYNVALPLIGQGERHYIVHKAAHSGIIDSVRDHQLGSLTAWMKNQVQ